MEIVTLVTRKYNGENTDIASLGHEAISVAL